MINLPWPQTDAQRDAQTQQRAETAVFEASRNDALAAQQQQIQAAAAASQQQVYAMRQNQRATAGIVLSELEQTFPELRSTAHQTRDARMRAQADYDAAHAQAHQHATTPPESRDAVDTWVEAGGALDRRVVGLGHLLRQAEAADQQAQDALGQAVERRVQQMRLAAMRESNTRRRALFAAYQERAAQLEVWAKAQLDALGQFEAEALTPLEQVVREGLVRGLPSPGRFENGLFRIEQ